MPDSGVTSILAMLAQCYNRWVMGLQQYPPVKLQICAVPHKLCLARAAVYVCAAGGGLRLVWPTHAVARTLT
jgi:hypothetical protein